LSHFSPLCGIYHIFLKYGCTSFLLAVDRWDASLHTTTTIQQQQSWWARGVPDHVKYEAHALDVVDFQTGFGSLPNHHCILAFLSTRYPEVAPYEDSMLNRFHDPGVGAFSYNKGREFVLSESTRAGSEIFLNYGYCERDYPNLPDWSDRIYMTEDYDRAVAFLEQYQANPASVQFLHSKNNEIILLPDYIQRNKLVAQLIPPTKRKLDRLVNSANSTDALLIAVAQASLLPRTPDWVKSNGICMENIVPGRSTIPQAGHGAFAQFPIVQGSIIAPAPLLQILDFDALKLYDKHGSYKGLQLLLNYCFGHPESTMLLCPNTNAVLINHCNSRKERSSGCRNGPNAEYRWASGWDPTSDDWRRMTLDQLLEQPGRGLAFEVVALQNIQAGEEITVDYGIQWEDAWKMHVKQWRPPPVPDDIFMTAREANEIEGPIIDGLISNDIRQPVRHSHLITGCRYWPTRQDQHIVYQKSSSPVPSNMTEDEFIRRFADDGRKFAWRPNSPDTNYSTHMDMTYWPCSVLKWQPSDDDDGNNLYYVVQIHKPSWERREIPWHESNTPRLLINYSRDMIHYFVRPYHSDQHLPNVFRHPMGIREELFPKQWKNRLDQKNTDNHHKSQSSSSSTTTSSLHGT
jgi:hypothetical protein